MKVQMIKWNRERLITLLMIVSLIVISSNLLGQELKITYGATVTIETKDGYGCTGELVRVMKDSLLLFWPEDTVLYSINIGDIWIIKIERSAAPGVFIGIVAGSILVGVVTKEIVDMFPGGSFGRAANKISIGVGAIIGGYSGGAIYGDNTIIRIEGESQDNIEASLIYLKSKERKERIVYYE